MAVERIQHRRGNAVQWASRNPILGSGELGFEVDTGKFKIGNGSSAWSELNYFETSDGIVVDLSNYYTKTETNTQISTAVANLVDSAPSTLDTLNEIAAALSDDANFATTILTELDGKADTVHTHSISQITNLQSTITSLQSAISSIESVNLTQQNEIDDLMAAPSPSASMRYSTTNTYALSAADLGNIISINSSTAVTFTVNNAFTPGEEATVYNKGTSIINFVAGSGVTLEGAGVSGVTLKLSNRFGAVNIFCERAGVYAIIGDVEIA